jgi:predicted outer membrane repeat protein
LNEAIDGAGAYFSNISSSDPIPYFLEGNEFNENIASGDGGGVYIESSDIEKIDDNFFIANEAGNGGGMYICESKIDIFRDNDLELNEATMHGGGMLLFESCVSIGFGKIVGNKSGGNGGGMYIEGLHSSSDPNVIVNCQISTNISESGNGGGVYTDYTFGSYSNTIAENHANSGIGGGIYHNSCSSTITNTIVYANTANTYNEAYPSPDGNNGYSYTCCSTTVANCATCTSSDPDFTGSGNYMIGQSSSCRDIGDNNAQIGQYDLVGGNRVTNTTIDIGAFEHPYLYLSSRICDQTWTNHNPNGTDYIITGDVTVGDGCSLTINLGTTIAFDQGTKLDVDGTISAKDATHTDYITFTATDPDDGWYGIDISDNSNTNEFEYCIFEKVKKNGGHGPNDFGSAGTVFLLGSSTSNTSFDYCIFRNNTVSHCGGGILSWEAKVNVDNCSFLNNTVTGKNGGGIFIGSGGGPHVINNCTFSENIANYGGGGIWMSYPETVNISNSDFIQNESHSNSQSALNNCGGGAIGIAVDRESSNSINISGGTISNNSATRTTYGYGNGGGIFVCFIDQPPDPLSLNILIENVQITDNEAANFGGGIYLYDCDNSVSIYSSKLQNNFAASNGGGIYMEDLSNNPILYNNLITSNVSGDDGGGIYFESSNPNIYSCTIADNEAGGAGGGLYDPGTSLNTVVKNTIIYDNLPDDVDINGNPADATTGVFEYSNIGSITGLPANNNIDAAPLWVDGYHLRYGDQTLSPATPQSPCINTGEPNYTPPGSSPYYDLDDNDRISDGRIDMGCYENDGTNSSWWIVFKDLSEMKAEEKSGMKLQIYPNPVEESLNIIITSERDDKINIQLINAFGQLVYNEQRNIGKGDTPLTMERKQLSSGVYFIRINASLQGSETKKIILK